MVGLGLVIEFSGFQTVLFLESSGKIKKKKSWIILTPYHLNKRFCEYHLEISTFNPPFLRQLQYAAKFSFCSSSVQWGNL